MKRFHRGDRENLSHSMQLLERYVPFTSFPIKGWIYAEMLEVSLNWYGQPSLKKQSATLIASERINSSSYINHWVSICGGLILAGGQVPTKLLSHSPALAGQGEKIISEIFGLR